MAVHEIGRYRRHPTPQAQDFSGVLYEGVEPGSGNLVYIKQSRGQRSSDVSTLQAWQGLHYAALATAKEEFFLDHQYLVVPRPEGELLSKSLSRLRKDGLWGRYRLMSIIIQVCKAVEAIHEADLIHGGINPDAIVVGQDTQAQVHLLCFEPFVPRPTSYYLEAGNQMFYLAQEQLRGGGDFASDIYALGMLLYMGFSAHQPFSARSPYELAEQVVWGDFAPFEPYLDNLNSDVGQAIAPDIEILGTIAARALRRKPEARYATVKEMRKLLEQLAKRLSPIVLGRILSQEGEPELAITVLQEASANPAVAAEAYLLQGKVYGFRLNNYNESFMAFKRAIRLNPDMESAVLGLADLYMEHGRYPSAKEQFERLLPKHPDDLQILIGYANALYRSGGSSAALNVLHQLQVLFPYFLSGYILAIQINMHENNLKDAETECTKAIERILQVVAKGSLGQDEVANIFFLRGLLHRKQGRNEQAIRWLHKAIERHPAHQQSHELLATLYAERGSVDEWLYHFLASHLEIESDPEIVKRVVSAMLDQGRLEDL
jgi:tetratricopeptide (TPR) repeat protein